VSVAWIVRGGKGTGPPVLRGRKEQRPKKNCLNSIKGRERESTGEDGKGLQAKTPSRFRRWGEGLSILTRGKVNRGGKMGRESERLSDPEEKKRVCRTKEKKNYLTWKISGIIQPKKKNGWKKSSRKILKEKNPPRVVGKPAHQKKGRGKRGGQLKGQREGQEVSVKTAYSGEDDCHEGL